MDQLILIASYEIRHSIYPDSNLFVGHCDRAGKASGLHDSGRMAQRALEPNPWDETEERLRLWRAVLILDR